MAELFEASKEDFDRAISDCHDEIHYFPTTKDIEKKQDALSSLRKKLDLANRSLSTMDVQFSSLPNEDKGFYKS